MVKHSWPRFSYVFSQLGFCGGSTALPLGSKQIQAPWFTQSCETLSPWLSEDQFLEQMAFFKSVLKV